MGFTGRRQHYLALKLLRLSWLVRVYGGKAGVSTSRSRSVLCASVLAPCQHRLTLWCLAPSTPQDLKSACDRMSAHSPDMKDTVAPLETMCRCYRWHASATPHDRPPNATLLLIRPSATWLKQLIWRRRGANSLWPFVCLHFWLERVITQGLSS